MGRRKVLRNSYNFFPLSIHRYRFGAFLEHKFMEAGTVTFVLEVSDGRKCFKNFIIIQTVLLFIKWAHFGSEEKRKGDFH